MMSHLDLANSSVMAILCGITILIVLIQPTIFMKTAWKHGRELGLTDTEMKQSVKSSAIFSIIPSLPIIVSYLLLVPAMGRFLPWLRLSVVGSVFYETSVANMAAESYGYGNIFSTNFPLEVFIPIILITSIGILGGNIFNVFCLKKYDQKVRIIQKKYSSAVPIITTAMFLGMYGTFTASHLTNLENIVGIITIFISGGVSLLCNKLSQRCQKLREFALPISLITGMLGACILNLFM